MNIQALHQVYRNKMYLENYHLIDVVLATFLTRTIPGDPVWLFPIGNSGYGKTETVRPIMKLDGDTRFDIKVLDQLNPRAFDTAIAGGHPLGAWLENKHSFLLIPDLANIVSMDEENKSKLFATLRTMFDGYIIRDTGSSGVQPRFTNIHANMVGFSTPGIEADISLASLMGTREIMYRLPKIANPLLMVDKEINEEDRNDLKGAVEHFLGAMNTPWVKPNEATKESIAGYSVRMALWRATGNFDRDGYLIGQIETELPKRLYVQLTKLWMGLAKMGLSQAEISVLFQDIENGCGNELREQIYWRLTHQVDDESTALMDVPNTLALWELSDLLNVSQAEVRKQLMVLRHFDRVEKSMTGNYEAESKWTGIIKGWLE